MFLSAKITAQVSNECNIAKLSSKLQPGEVGPLDRNQITE